VLLSLWRPDLGLLAVAALLPLSTPVGDLLRPALAGQDAGELLLLSFLFGANGSFALGVRVASSALGPSVAACAAVVVGATTVTLARQSESAASIAELWWRHATTAYFVESALVRRLHDGMIWIEALLLAYVADLLLRQHRALSARLPYTLLAGVVGASLFSGHQLIDVLLQHSGSVGEAVKALATTRIGVHDSDVNAMGSLYALLVVPALWIAWSSRGRPWGWAAFLSIAAALWWTGSRAAIVAACAGGVLTTRFTRMTAKRALPIAVSLSVGIVLLSMVQSYTAGESGASALRIRVEMAKVGLHVLAAHPAFGVGPHQVLPASRPLISEPVLALFPAAAHGENAHNNLIQILAEFGIIGGLVLLSSVALTLRRSTKALHSPTPEPTLLGFVGGLYAFLVSCLLGHPLLVPLCLWLFFLTVGLVSGLTPPRDSQISLWETRASYLVVGLIAISMPWRIAAARSAPDPVFAVAVDTIPTRGTLDGIPYTTVDRVFGLAVPSIARVVILPLRLTPASRASCVVRLSADGHQVGAVNPPIDHWLQARYVWRPAKGMAAGRLDVVVRETDCRVMVGQMTVE
jgi:hypothetical protein